MNPGRRTPTVAQEPTKEDEADAQAHQGPVASGRPWSGRNINFVTCNATVDATPLLKGLPNDQCHCPHSGYVIKGEVSYTVNGVEEIYKEGDAFYVPAGHTSGATAGAEIIQFSPSDLLAEVEATIMRNMQAMRG